MSDEETVEDKSGPCEDEKRYSWTSIAKGTELNISLRSPGTKSCSLVAFYTQQILKIISNAERKSPSSVARPRSVGKQVCREAIKTVSDGLNKLKNKHLKPVTSFNKPVPTIIHMVSLMATSASKQR